MAQAYSKPLMQKNVEVKDDDFEVVPKERRRARASHSSSADSEEEAALMQNVDRAASGGGESEERDECGVPEVKMIEQKSVKKREKVDKKGAE